MKRERDERILVGDERLGLTFTPRGELAELSSAREGFRIGLRGELWQVILRKADGHTVAAGPSGPPTSVKPSADRRSLTLAWSQPVAGSRLEVRVRVAVDAETALARWRCEVRFSGDAAVWEVTCPRLGGIGPMVGDGSGDRLAIPWQYGGLVPNPIRCIAEGGSRAYGISMDYGYYDAEEAVGRSASRIAYSYPGMWSLQFVAFYNPSAGGIYLGAHDPQARYKRFGLYGQPGAERADMVMQHYPDERVQPGLDYATPYDTVVGLFKGEWWEASRIYRDWALGQRWCARGPLRGRTDLPAWLLATDLWYWNWVPTERLGNHGRVEHLVPAILDLKQRLGAEMAFHWYEWDDRKFNELMPEVFPLAPAALETLRSGLQRLHDAGVHAIPYVNARLWSTNHPAWKTEGEPAACRTPDGQVAWYDNLEGWAQMCTATLRWQRAVGQMCDAILDDCGMDGAYLDQITSCYAVPCFSAGHGHPRGGGNTWYAGYRAMMERIQRRSKERHPDAVFTSESTIDCYLDLFDANLAREASEMSSAHSDPWLPIPLFPSVYHDYAITYGTVMRLVERFPEAYYYGEALVLNGGQQLMVEDYMAWDVGTDHYADYLGYLRRLVQVRRLARSFLLFGRWMPPIDLHADPVMVRWSDTRPPKGPVPAIVTSSWLLDGALCLVLVNHTNVARAFRYELPLADYGLAGGTVAMEELTADGPRRSGGPTSGTLAAEGVLEPRSARAYVLKGSNPA